jgi:uncharacterized protein
MEYIGYLASILIGISLGLIGSGGSILTVPILVYLFHITPENATSYSLFIVGITALVGSFTYYKSGHLHSKTALYFAIPSVTSLLLVRKILLPKLPAVLFTVQGFTVSKDFLILFVFALFMIMASVAMIKKPIEDKPTRQVQFFELSLIGIGIGIVTGFLGAGGGFMIIPALLFFGGLPMKQAVGTSLFIIFINSFIGFAGDVITGIDIDYKLLAIISVMAIVGMLLGIRLSKKIDDQKLKPLFGWFVLAMGVYIITKELFIK